MTTLDHCTMQLDPVIWARIERKAQTMHSSDNWHEMLRLMDFREQVTSTEVMTELGVSRNSARKMLDVLRDLRVIRTEALPAHTLAYILNREDLWVLFA